MTHGRTRGSKTGISSLVGKFYVWAVVFALFGWAGQAAAQRPAQIVTVIHPRNLTRLEVADEVLLSIPHSATDPFDYWFTPAGRFKLYTGPNIPAGRGGNPTYEGDEDKRIASAAGPTGINPADPAYYGDWTSGFLLAVDPDDPNQAQFVDPFQLALQQARGDNPSDLTQYWPQRFAAGSRDVVGTARVPIEFQGTGSNRVAVGWASIQVEYKLIGDALQVALVVTNEGTTAHDFGLRIVFDAGFDSVGTVNDGQPIFLPSGQVITGETVIQGPFTEKTATWVAYDNPQRPILGVRGFVGTANTPEIYNRGTATEAAGMPDQIEFGQLRNAGVGIWNFVPNPAAPLLGMDWAYAVKWQARRLAPRQSRRFVTWYGVGTSSPSYDFPFAMMAYVPLRLEAVQDPTTGEYFVADMFGNSPMPVALYIDNYGPSPLLNATGKVRLPAGFDLAEGGPTVNIGIIPNNELDSATWDVVATATRPGKTNFKFTGPAGRTVTAEVSVPVLPILYPLPSTHPAFEMVSFPFTFANSSARNVLASLGDLSPGGPATIVRYDPGQADPTLRYRFYPDPFAASIQPGAGYWLLNLNRLPITLPEDRAAVSTNTAFNLVVYRGWNQIGNPFHYTIDFMTLSVIDSANRRWTMEEAISRQLILPTLFWWDPYERQYKWEVNPHDVVLDPYMGYWLLAYDNLVLLVPPPAMQWTASARGSHAAVPASKPSAGEWRISLCAATGQAKGERVQIGVAPDGKDGWDRWDLPVPPEPAALREPRVRMAAVGPEACPCLVDIRPQQQAVHEWTLEIITNQPGEAVRVTWPDLSTLPSDLLPTLVDMETGARRYMRTTSAYTFTSSPVGAPRRLKVLVQARNSTAPMVTSAHVQPQGRGAVLVYTLSAPAEVDITVRNMAGRCVRHVASGRLSDVGTSRVVWNGLSDNAVPVPPGRYLVHLSAKSPETGQSYQVVRPVQLGH
jgi:hypothetical protein